ncbi:MAG: hypothetical protein DRI44_06025 [Chlamydiae bacterium]|nr:MAG: hypothetical protein DRI44_06025 [Chlamydiota bacterium]
MSIKKISKKSIVLNKVPDGTWANTNIAEIFPAAGDTKMSCGVHELFASEIIVEKAPVDDVLYILEGEMEIDSDGVVEKFEAGDFAYLRAGARQVFKIRDRVKHIYVTYPCNWITDK